MKRLSAVGMIMIAGFGRMPSARAQGVVGRGLTRIAAPDRQIVSLDIVLPNNRIELAKGEQVRFEIAIRYSGVARWNGISQLSLRNERGEQQPLPLPQRTDENGIIRSSYVLQPTDMKPGVYTIEASAGLPGANRRTATRFFTYAPENIRNDTLRTSEERTAFLPLMDIFWAAQLAAVQNRDRQSDPAPSLDWVQSNYLVKVYKVSFNAVEGERIYGWLAMPASGGPFPGVVELPYFGNKPIMPPTWLARMGFAALAINVHGADVAATTYPSEEETYVGGITTPNIADPQTFVYRRMMTASLGAVDYLAQHPDVDATRLGIVGFSQGGGLAVNVAALDPRIKVVVANSPGVDFTRMLATATMNPMRSLLEDLERHDPQAPQVLQKTLSYFEPTLLAERLRAPLLITTNTGDPTTPPSTAYALKNAVPIGTPVQLPMELSSGHKVTSHQAYASLVWLREHLQSTAGGS